MKWRGFLIESKSYMGYDNMTSKEKVHFWLIYPKAFVYFNYLQIKVSVLYYWYNRK